MHLWKCLEWKVDLCVNSFGAGFCEHSCNQCIIFKNCLCRGMVGEKGGGDAMCLVWTPGLQVCGLFWDWLTLPQMHMCRHSLFSCSALFIYFSFEKWTRRTSSNEMTRGVNSRLWLVTSTYHIFCPFVFCQSAFEWLDCIYLWVWYGRFVLLLTAVSELTHFLFSIPHIVVLLAAT